MRQYPDQKVSSSHKHNNKEWARDMCEYVIALSHGYSNKTQIREFLSAANAEVSDDKYNYLLKKYEGDEDMKDAINKIKHNIHSMRDVDFITPIKEKFMGEFINSYHNYQAFIHDPDIVFKRNQELGKMVYANIMQNITNQLNQMGVMTGQENMEMPDIEVMLEEEKKKWRNERGKDAQHILDYLNDVTGAKDKYVEAFYYWFVTNQCITYRTIRNGEVVKEIKSPLEYYRVESGNMFIEDDDYGMCHEKVSFHKILDDHRDILSKENIAWLEELIHNRQHGAAIDVPYELLRSRVWMLNDKCNYNNNFRVTFADKHCIVDRYHCVFKTPVKQGVLTYITPDGIIEDTIVDEMYKKNEAAGDIDLKWEYVNQVWECWKYGNEEAAIYTKPRPIEVQRELVNNNSVCKLPYNGVTWLNIHNKPNPVPYRLIDYLALYRIYTLQQEKWINRFKSWITFPESITAKSEEMSVRDRFEIADTSGIYVFNDSIQENPNSVNLIREVATSSVVDFIKILSQLRQEIKEEAMQLASWTPTRDGDVNPRQGKSVTETALTQSINASAWLYQVFNAMRERDYLADIDYSKFAWKDGKQGAYIDPNTNEIVELDIDGAAHAATNYGVVVRNSAKLNEMFTAMKDIAFAAAQGGEFAMAADAIVSTNIFETKELIEKHVKATRDFQEKLKQMEQEGIIKAQELKNESEQAKNETNIAVAQIEADSNIRIAEINYEREILKEELRLERDLNGNGFIDKEEAESYSGKSNALSILDDKRLDFDKDKEAYKRMDADRRFKLEQEKLKRANNQRVTKK